MMIFNYHARNVTLLKRFRSSTSRILPKEDLPCTTYKPEVTEKDKYKRWEKSKLHHAKFNDQPLFSMVLPPPNVTGKLHLGHTLSCTIQDVIARKKRSQGYNVMWLPGTDHAGIATQRVVEKYLKTKKNIDRHSLGKEEFTKEVWKWKEKQGNTISNQLRMLGCSLDWSRETFTMDENHSHSVTTAFINLFHKGLIYRNKGLVNWCNALKSTVSDIEVENIGLTEVTERFLPGYDKPVKFGLLYNFAYKIVDSTEEIVVSTTMPETMLGDMAVAVHPDDSRYKHLHGKLIHHHFREKPIPIILNSFVDMSFGTGAVKITPAHSKVDFEIAKQNNLPLLQVINENGCMENAGKFNGLKKYDCREILVEHLREIGLLKSVTTHQMSLPICSRTGDVIEYLPKEQWFLSCALLNERAAHVAEEGHLKIVPDHFTKQWQYWTNDCRDWCISRQLWWGHQIPAYKCSIDKNFVWIAATNETTARVEASKFLRSVPENITVVQDTDVLDTWFSSGIYPFSSLGWPETKSQDYKKFYPLHQLVTGHDILGFWVHRMVMLGLELTDELPFKNVLLHGIICDSKGAKMSKSKGNVINPLDVINGISMDGLKDNSVEMFKEGILNKDELNKALAYHKAMFSSTNGIPECGVDALRFTLMSQDVKSHFVNFDVHQCNANKLFCNKIWQSVKYTQLSFAKLKNINLVLQLEDLTYFDQWILSKLSHMVDRVNIAMEKYEFHIATKALKTFIYNEFCDIYLEATKPGFDDSNAKIAFAHAHTLSAVLNTSLRSLSPFMIYLTDEIIPKIPAFEKNIIVNFNDINNDFFELPESSRFKCFRNPCLENRVEIFLKTISLIREVKGFCGISNKERPSVVIKTRDVTLKEDVQSNLLVALNLTRCSEISFDELKNKKYVNSILNETTNIFVEIPGEHADRIIVEAKAKLQKKIKKIEENLGKLETKLTSNHYIHKVPDRIQIEDNKKLEIKKEELRRLQRLM
ncbi:valine--tRNA ligase, mitochondrial 1 isoform X1 [Pieris brassicae]|uniref:valine--tRNA ligase, mitochondrial 1 isoform X1 n=2 Tax=Pieris brassicae TaxID=7116 RepID=UPI001E66206C|nr:valine--tRNA ligase, mitochondrial 1 isoform X1 [Pieris brassicae]